MKALNNFDKTDRVFIRPYWWPGWIMEVKGQGDSRPLRCRRHSSQHWGFKVHVLVLRAGPQSTTLAVTVNVHFQIFSMSESKLFKIRDGRILIFSWIPDSDTRHLISGRSRIRIFDVTTVSLYLQQNTGNRIQLLFSVIHNVTHVT